MTLSEILSQDKAIRHLKSMLATERIPPSLLFCGPAGCGKFPTAMAFAAALNCTRIPYSPDEQKPKKQQSRPPEDDLFSMFGGDNSPAEEEKQVEEEKKETLLDVPLGEACGKCLSCIQMANGAHPDITITGVEDQNLKTGKESGSLKVDTMREMLKKAYQKSFLSPYKVFIVRDAEKLLPEAQNAILKTLEAPPEGTIIILICSDRNALLPTILSRTATVDFGPLSKEAMTRLLAKEDITGKTAEFLAKASQGSLDKARNIKIFIERAARLPYGDRTNALRFAAMLPTKESHKAREETNAMLELMISREREIWRDTPERQSEYAKLINDTIHLRSLTNRNVSSQRILEAALLASETAGISIERLLDIS